MSGIVSKAAPVFRRSFKIPNADALRWFPGHMDKGTLKSKDTYQWKYINLLISMCISEHNAESWDVLYFMILKENLFLRNETDGE